MKSKIQIRGKVTGKTVRTVDNQQELIEFFSNSTRPTKGYFAWEIDTMNGRILDEIDEKQLKEMVNG